MKKLVMIISLMMAFTMMVAPAVMANTISAGDYVKLTVYNSNGNGGIMTYAVSHNGGLTTDFFYDTFCIQDNVYIWANTWYPVADVSNNVGYDPTAPPAGAGPLNQAVDYLFALFASGNYNDQFYTGSIPDQKSNQYDFQATLWSLQGSGPVHPPTVGTEWAADLATYNANLSLHHSWGTKVINIVSNVTNGYDIQNQLYHQVPEPTSMLLLGLGLMGLAGVRRKLQE